MTRRSPRFGASLAYSIRITRPARRDAQKYAAFIRDEHHSPEAARRWLDGLFLAIKELLELPQRFSIIPEAEELGFPYRSFVYHSHRVIYAVHESEQLVIVHRIYHGARNRLVETDIR